jgi:PAS domain S-box-containing protein
LTARTGEVLGMISTHWRQPHAPSERELRLFDLIARQAADLLQHRNSAELVRESAERARLVIDAAQLGTWTYNLESGFVTLDERMRAIWGEPPTRSVLPFEAMLNGVNADHREAVAVAVASAIDGDSTALHEMEIRLADAAGGERWVAMSGRAVFDIRSEESRAMKFLGTAIDVTNAKRAEAELLRALAAKDDFLSLVSHELRTPITTILGNADVLLRHGDVLSAETREDSLRDIRHDARRLNRTVDDLLTVARAERGALEPEPVALSRALHNIVGDYERETNSRIALEVDDPSCIVLAERGVLGQILRNYLSNAEKYGLGKPLQVTLECTPREALVRVLDRGIGVDPEEADRLFDVFYRSKDAGPIGGMGIGLAVCRRLAEAVGGRVWAARREGGGSEFGLALALCDDAPDDAAE